MIKWEEHKENCCVVIPVHSEDITFREQTSLMQCVRILGRKYDIFLVCPDGLNLEIYKSICPNYKFREKRLSPGFFESIDTYNELCKRDEFYEAFSGYEFMLVYQLDCWIFEDRLDYFMSLGYDYIGAPWFKVDTVQNKITLTQCGNGGFSLRRIGKFIEVCQTKRDEILNSDDPEDVFFSTKCGDLLKISPIKVGYDFSFEVGPSALFKLNGNKLPMGCHKPYLFQYNTFWKNFIKF